MMVFLHYLEWSIEERILSSNVSLPVSNMKLIELIMKKKMIGGTIFINHFNPVLTVLFKSAVLNLFVLASHYSYK